MIKKALLVLAAAGAVLAAAGVVVVAITFAVYAGFRDLIGPAWAAAATAGIAAVLAAIGALVAVSAVKPHKPNAAKLKKNLPPASPMERALDLFKARPVTSVAALAAGAVIVFRNPVLAATVAKSLFDMGNPPRR